MKENKKAITLMASPERKGMLCRLQNAVGLDTGGADLHAHCSSINAGTHILEIRQPAPPGAVMGVTDIISCDRLLAADFTHSSHGNPRIN